MAAGNAQERDRADVADLVASEASRRIRAFLSTRDDWNPTRSLTELTSQVAHEYQDRFVIELIQNAYDAHAPGTRNGFVEICLDAAAGGHGTLYVANGGRPFATENFEALTNLSQSNKPAGEGIGNKGLGFRSVLQVCDWPEVYSADPGDTSSAGFGGFCFGFATDEDIRQRTETLEDFAVVEREFSRHLLPVPAQPEDPRLLEFRHRGAVTVIKLPLKSELALKKASLQLHHLTTDQVPVLLFLRRLERLLVQRIGPDGQSDRHQLTRSATPLKLPTGDSSLEFAQVTCDDQRFFVASRRLDHDDVLHAIDVSIQEGQLDARWRDWRGDADVEVAIPLQQREAGPGGGHEDDEFTGQMFTYLPMETESPLGGHANAPFYTKLARTALDVTNVPLNRFFMGALATLCLDSAALIANSAVTGGRGIAVDLISWDEHFAILAEESQSHGATLEERRLIPTLQDGAPTGWSALIETYSWEPVGSSLDEARLSRAGATLVDPGIGGRRRTRLDVTHRHIFDRDLSPDGEELAGWVEQAFAQAARSDTSRTDWAGLYEDLAAAFKRQPESLRGRKVILDQDGRLRHAGPADKKPANAPTVFFPPRVADDDDSEGQDLLHVPSQLGRAVAYLNDAVPVRRREGRTTVRTHVADFLSNNRLVEDFNRSNIITHLTRYTQRRSVADSTRAAVLRWVYGQSRAARGEGLSNLASFGIQVPTRGGWVEASRATFSAGWPETLGEQLEQLLSLVGSGSPSLGRYADTLLLGPADFPFTVIDPADFQRFLLELGVRNGLWPYPVATPRQQNSYGSNYDPRRIASQASLSEGATELWVKRVRATWNQHAVRHPQTRYFSSDQLWVLPGQDDIQSLDDGARRDYAHLLASSIGDWPAEFLRYAFRLPKGHRSGPDEQVWPSPASSFLQSAPWMPSVHPAGSDELFFATPSETWHFDGEGGDPRPRFAPLCVRDIQRVLVASPSAARRLRSLGLRVWDSASTAPGRLKTIAELVSDNEIRPADVSLVRKANERAWADLRITDADDGSRLLTVSRGRRLEVVDQSTQELVYLPDATSTLVGHVIEAAELPVVVVAPADGPAVGDVLRDQAWDVRLMSEVVALIEADGAELDPDSAPGIELVAQGAWLPQVVALATELNPFVRATANVLQQVLTRLRRIRLVWAEHVRMTVDGVEVPLADIGRSGIHLQHEEAPLIVLLGDRPVFDWSSLATVSEHVAELIGHPSTSDVLRAAALTLDRNLGGNWAQPLAEELAGAFRVSPDRVRETLESLSGGLDRLAELAAIELAWRGLIASGRDLLNESFRERHDLERELLNKSGGAVDPDEVLARAQRAETHDDLRRALSADLPSFNDALRKLGFAPLSFGERRVAALRNYTDRHREEIVARLRSAYLEAFRSREDLSSYLGARSLDVLVPDADWLERFVEPPDAAIGELVEAWLRKHGAGVPDPNLAPIDEVRERNTAIARSVVKSASPVVAAWTAANHVSRQPEWDRHADILQNLHGSGALDFEILTEPDVIEWLGALGLWPDGMDATTDLEELGLTPGAIDAASQSADAEREARERRRTTIRIGNQELDASEDGWQAIADTVMSQLGESGTGWSKSLTKLSPPPRRAKGGRKKVGRGRRHRPGESGLSEAQRSAVGLVGEVIAYRWLLDTYPETTPDSWASGYRQLVVGGHEGDDTLGYDFEIHQKSQSLYFEVKATAGDAFEFEFAASEVRAAAAARKATYRIIFIRNALDPQMRELLVLPNPLDPDHAAAFHQLNTGMRLRFSPEE